MPDGKGFVMVRPVEQDRQLVMVMNWGEELRQRTGRQVTGSAGDRQSAIAGTHPESQLSTTP